MPDDDPPREALLAEVKVWSRAYPYLSIYFVARAIHAARLPSTADVEDLDRAALVALVAAMREAMTNLSE